MPVAPRTTTQTVVLGAGPAGLCSAYVLSKAGENVTVVEAAPFVGGLGRTLVRDTEFGEFRFDIGGHRWFSGDSDLDDLFQEVVADELVTVERSSRIWFNDRFIDYPLNVRQALRAVGPITAAAGLKDYIRTRASGLLSRKPLVTMEDAYIHLYGETLYRKFFKSYSEKIWGQPCHQLSADWVIERTGGLSLLQTVRKSVRRAKNTSASLIRQFQYPALGFGRFSERMADRVRNDGNTILLESGVERVYVADDKVVAVQIRTASGSERISGDNFISSIPLTVLARIIEPSPPPEVTAAAESLTFRDIITVNLMFRKPQITPDTWVYVHDPRILFGRFHEPKNWSAAMAPSEDVTSLVVEYFCSKGDAIWNMSDEQLIRQTVRHIVDDLRLAQTDEVIGGFTLRATKAYPVYELDYQTPLNVLQLFFEKIVNLQYVGRGGTFRYNNTDHSIETGLRAAQHVLGTRT